MAEREQGYGPCGMKGCSNQAQTTAEVAHEEVMFVCWPHYDVLMYPDPAQTQQTMNEED